MRKSSVLFVLLFASVVFARDGFLFPFSAFLDTSFYTNKTYVKEVKEECIINKLDQIYTRIVVDTGIKSDVEFALETFEIKDGQIITAGRAYIAGEKTEKMMKEFPYFVSSIAIKWYKGLQEEIFRKLPDPTQVLPGNGGGEYSRIILFYPNIVGTIDIYPFGNGTIGKPFVVISFKPRKSNK